MISHKHKFIFFHIPKTGGTSALKILHKLCDESKLRIGHPKLRIVDDNYHLVNNHNDIKLKQVDYIVITIVRNPFQRVVSAFHYLKSRVSKYQNDLNFCTRHELNRYNFSEFVKYKLNEASSYIHFKNIIGDYILEEDIGRIDFIGRFETLQQDFDIICDKIGIPRQQLPHKNKSKHKHYTEYYDDETKQIVAEKYAKDIEYFGYEFGE